MNGTIQAQIITGGGKDADGYPIKPVITWSNSIECKYIENTFNNRGKYIDGGFTQMSFSITLFDLDFDAKIVRLTSNRGKIICEKEVQSLNVLEEIQRVKITI
jgi:uncharacterized protein YcnI